MEAYINLDVEIDWLKHLDGTYIGFNIMCNGKKKKYLASHLHLL